jgi:hypothetical protein
MNSIKEGPMGSLELSFGGLIGTRPIRYGFDLMVSNPVYQPEIISLRKSCTSIHFGPYESNPI